MDSSSKCEKGSVTDVEIDQAVTLKPPVTTTLNCFIIDDINMHYCVKMPGAVPHLPQLGSNVSCNKESANQGT